MNPKNRLAKLLAEARIMAGKRRRTIRPRQCQNVTWEALLRMVEESIPAEFWPIVEDINAQVEEYQQRPPRESATGEMVRDVHGFVYWLWALHAGSSSLPEQIPHEFLLAWRNGHAHHPAGASPRADPPMRGLLADAAQLHGGRLWQLPHALPGMRE